MFYLVLFLMKVALDITKSFNGWILTLGSFWKHTFCLLVGLSGKIKLCEVVFLK